MEWRRVGLGYMARRVCSECGHREWIDPFGPEAKEGGQT